MNTRLMQHAEPLPGYRLIERLGRGGYGEVWKAEAPGGLFKAIKFVYGDLDQAGDDNKAAEQELKALHRVKTIRHPYILSIERFDIIAGQLMIVMELADRNLWDRFHECRNQGLVGLPRDELLRYMDETSEVLDLMNSHYQIQHLDIKPQNLFLVHNHVKVADFGLAKDFEGIRAAVTGGVTPVYAAPETFEGWISRFCDQYSLAIVYQELLTGVRPFSGTNTRHLLMQHISAVPDVSSLPPNEREAVSRALSKKPEDRWPTCGDFVRAIRESNSAPARVPIVPVAPTVDPLRTVPNFRPGKTPDTASAQPMFTPPNPELSPLPSPLTQRPPVILKGLPRLVTPGSAASQAAARGPSPTPMATPITIQRPTAFETGQISSLGIAPPEKNGEGVLMPVYIVGAGKVGLQVMQRLRAYLHDRLGRGDFPHWKWLFIDTDLETVHSATNAEKREALSMDEVCHAKLHRPGHYLKREGLPSPDTWMSNETLYRIPREPATDGIRALGRLALLDHYPTISQKIRKDLETFLSDDVLLEADRQTKLGIRGNRPRVYVASSLCGGTGAGMLIDLAYIIRQEMRQMGFTKPHLTGLLLTPGVERTTPKTLPIANVCTTLAEIDHFSQPSARFEARFDTRLPSVADPERPFERCVLLSLPRSPSKTAPPNADRAAGLIYQETLTPLGRGIDEARTAYQKQRAPVGVSLQSFGFYRITWPRQRLLDTIAERFAARTIQQWCTKDAAPIRGAVAEWFNDQWKKQQLDPASLSSVLEAGLANALNEKPEVLIEAEAQNLPHEPALAAKMEVNDVLAIVERVLQIVGKPGADEEYTPGRLVGLLEAIAKPLTKESEVKFAKMAVHFVEQPQFRMAGAEDAIRLCTERVQSLIDENERENLKRSRELEEEFSRMLAMLGALSQGGFFKAEKRRAAAVADLNTWMLNWPGKRLQFLLSRYIISIYRQMLGNAPEYLREVSLCRQRMSEVAGQMQKMAEASSDPGPSQDHPILPSGCRNLLEAADRFIAEQPPEAIRELEDHLQQQIRRHLRGLVNVCLSMNESGVRFKELLIAQFRAFVDARLGQHTPAEEFFRNRPDAQLAQREILLAYDESTPEPFGPTVRQEAQSLLIGVTSDAHGKRLMETAQELIPEFQIRVSPSANEIVLYREFHDLVISETPQAGALAAEAVRAVKTTEKINPHSRTDVQWASFLRE